MAAGIDRVVNKFYLILYPLSNLPNYIFFSDNQEPLHSYGHKYKSYKTKYEDNPISHKHFIVLPYYIMTDALLKDINFSLNAFTIH